MVAPAEAGRAEVEVSRGGSEVANPVIVIDNYDSFTYNLCQVGFWVFLFYECQELCFFLNDVAVRFINSAQLF